MICLRTRSALRTKVIPAYRKQCFSLLKSDWPDDRRLTYVIVGAGSAGCVLANRLSEDPNSTILVIESGPPDHWYNWKIHMPGAVTMNLGDDKVNWFYETEPEPQINGRKIYWPRGRVWGGSSALNVMVYVRGHPLDYDRWANEEGAVGWSYASCLPYFKKAQSHCLGGDLYRGDSGPLHVTRDSCDGPLSSAWVKAGIQAGYGFTDDMNGFRQEGFGAVDRTVYRGKRWSASQAYLRPALKRPNVRIMSNANANKIIFDGSRAVGLELEQGNLKKTILVDRDVILCGGAINSTQLLQLSGVGNGDDLRKLEIPVVHHLRGVGANLQDHFGLNMKYFCREPVSLHDQFSRDYPHKMAWNAARWFLSRSGMSASTQFEVGAFIRSSSKMKHPDIQLQLLPFTVHSTGAIGGKRHEIQVHAQQMRPTSKGHLRLRSKDPRNHPQIYANYLSTDFDWDCLRSCVGIIRNIFEQQALRPLMGDEFLPGKLCETKADIDAFIRKNAGTSFHPCGTCKMGSEKDSDAVVDAETMKIFGVDGLRVIDASIMPSIVSGNLNAPVIMMAERAADLIRGKPLLSPLEVPVWKPDAN